MDWDQAYANADYIPNGTQYPQKWMNAASAFRNQVSNQKKIRYGDDAREWLDLFLPSDSPQGLIVFVHGGYWMEFGASYWSHLVQGAIANRYAGVVLNYPLCPQVRIAAITRAVARAITTIAAIFTGKIVLSGHSAGGHLVTRMLCHNLMLDTAIRKRILRIVSISGVHDLRPLCRTKMNATLQLNAEEAIAESPALQEPFQHARLICCSGTRERPEFRRQSALLANIWQGFGVHTVHFKVPGCHHFDIIEALTEPHSTLTQMLIGQ